jgi:hypothetical protein
MRPFFVGVVAIVVAVVADYYLTGPASIQPVHRNEPADRSQLHALHQQPLETPSDPAYFVRGGTGA